MNNEIKIFNGETLPERQNPPKNAVQMRTQYTTAVIVPVPRDEEKIIAKIEKIARYVGNDFFYLWPVKNKDEVSMISGGTIDLAETLVYYWSNIAIEHDIEDLGNSCKIKHGLIDGERGLQWRRTTIVHKPKDTPGGWDKARWERMNLNKANSYNLRDLVFSVIPRWMKNKIINVAKEAELKKASDELSTGKAKDFFLVIQTEYHLSESELMTFLGAKGLDTHTYFQAKNLYAQLKRGDIKPDQIRGDKKEAKTHKETSKENPTPKASSKVSFKKSEPVDDKAVLIKQIYKLAQKDDIPIEAIEGMLGVKTLKSVEIGILDGIINEWNDIKKKFIKEPDTKGTNLI